MKRVGGGLGVGSLEGGDSDVTSSDTGTSLDTEKYRKIHYNLDHFTVMS